MDVPKFEEGKWYCVGWDNDDGSTMWDAMIRYEGYGTFTGDDGNIVNGLYDPILQCLVAVNAADHYQLQA